MIAASLILLLAAETPRVLDAADVRRQLGFSRLCSAKGEGAFLDVVAGENRPDIELRRSGAAALFARGRFAAATMVEHGNRHLAIRVEGETNGQPADLDLTVRPGDARSMPVSAVLRRAGAAPQSFTCIPVPPAPSGSRK